MGKAVVTSKRRIGSNAQSIGEVLRRPVSYVVPVNQRDFAWTQEEVDLLWQDVVNALEEERGEYFLGAIVLAPNKDNAQLLEIVDGQQRLAALSMILAAIHQTWKSRKDDEQAAEVFRDYLGSKDRKSREISPKLRLNETNDPVFQAIVLRGETATETERKAWPKSNRLLYEAFVRLQKHLSEWLKKNPDAEEEALIDLEKYVAGNANVIAIEVGDEYDAFVIFETLNDRGLELAVADLVKNYLFSLAAERLDAFKKAWSEIALLVGSENLTPFLRHLWLSEYQFVRERDLYRNLRDKVKTERGARQFVERLRKAADLYAALLNQEAPYWTDVPDDAREHLKALRLFRAAQFRPLALSVMEGGTGEQVAQMLRVVSVLTFRYTIVSGYNANQLERIYSDAAMEVRKNGKRNVKSVFDLVKSAYIDDARFAENFAEATFGKAELARYVLVKLNDEMEKDGAVGAKEEAISLEHIMPKNPGKEWVNAVPVGDDPDEWIEAIGNLTLLEKPVNRGIGSKDFKTKKAKGYSSSKLALNAAVAKKNEWTSKEIDERSKTLAEVAKKVWELSY
jgi:uncharacterized protein with ParB-like and HNH nuclease domain